MRHQLSSLQSEYERIIRPIEQQMMLSVWRITQNGEDADDAFQEAMTQIWQRLPRIRSHPKSCCSLWRTRRALQSLVGAKST